MAQEEQSLLPTLRSPLSSKEAQMKRIFPFLISFSLLATEPKKVEWFPNISEENNFPCEGSSQGLNPWGQIPEEDKPLKQIEELKKIGQTASCKFLDIKF